MNNGFITCPCCGQILYVSYSDLIGFTASLPISNKEDLQKQINSQQYCSIQDTLTRQLEQIKVRAK